MLSPLGWISRPSIHKGDTRMSEPANELKWKELIILGNEAFSIGKHAEADRLFVLSLREATRLFDIAKSGIRIDAAFLLVMSHHNISDNLLRLGQLDEALLHLEAAFEKVCEGAAPNGGPQAFRQYSCFQIPVALEKLLHLVTVADKKTSEIDRWLRMVARSAA